MVCRGATRLVSFLLAPSFANGVDVVLWPRIANWWASRSRLTLQKRILKLEATLTRVEALPTLGEFEDLVLRSINGVVALLALLIEFLPSPSLLRGPSAFSLLGQIRRVSPSALVAAGPPRDAPARSEFQSVVLVIIPLLAAIAYVIVFSDPAFSLIRRIGIVSCCCYCWLSYIA